MTLRTGMLLAVFLLAAGCGGTMPPDKAMASLQDPDASVRRRAADSLRADTEHGVPPAAVPDLLQALESEEVPEVRGAILITLGRSGAPEAEKPINDALAASGDDTNMHRWALRARKYWELQTGERPGNANASYWAPFGLGQTANKIGP